MSGRVDALWLAIDQGGHASRAIVYDAAGRVVASGRAPIATTRPRPGWVEHDGDEIVGSVRRALAEVVETLGARTGHVRAAGLATQRSSVIAWDRGRGTPLSPVLSWQDVRAAEWLASLPAHQPPVADITGLVLSPHYGVSKLRWLLDHHEPVARAAAEGRLAFGPLASFLLFHLARQRPRLVDPANASRTLLCEWRSGTWSPALLQHFGIDPAMLPECVPSRGDFGHLELDDGTVLPIRVPIRVMTGDQSAAVFAGGTPPPDRTLVNVGTGAFVQRVTPEPPETGGGLLRSIVWRDDAVTRYALEGTVNGAGAAIEVVAAEGGLAAADAIARIPAALDAITDPPLFLNGVGGLGAPYWRSDFASRFVGEGDVAARLVAVVESIAFLLAVNVHAVEAELGPSSTLVVSGGGAAFEGLIQRLADLTERRIERPHEHEATTRGLAFLLARPRSWPATPADTILPRSNPALAGRFARWREQLDAALV